MPLKKDGATIEEIRKSNVELNTEPIIRILNFEFDSSFEFRNSKLSRGGQFGLRGTFRRPILLRNLALLGKTSRLADAVAEIEELGPAGFTAALHSHLRDKRGMQWEDSFDAFVIDDSANGEGFVDARTLPHD